MKVKLLKEIEVKLITDPIFINKGTVGEVMETYKNPERYDITFGHRFYLATNVPKEYIEFI